jgi:hypothetical protein
VTAPIAISDVQLGTEPVKLGQQPLGHSDRQTGDLDVEAVMMLGRALDQHDVPAVLVADQQQGQAQARQRRARPVRQIDQRGRAQPQRRQRLACHQLLQRDITVVRRDRDTAHVDGPARRGRPGVDRGLQVDVLEGVQLARDH